MKETLIHIPHSSYFIPKKYRELFYLSDEELKTEQIKMTDSYTDKLFNIEGIDKLVFKTSRLICDVERFRSEKDEEMTKQGMWVCYEKASDLKPLKAVNKKHKKEILEKYYDKHHFLFEKSVEQMLEKYKKCLIIDAHSFSSTPLPYELHSSGFRPEICLGVDKFHTPRDIVDYFYNSFKSFGYKVEINNPFVGTIVPLKYYGKNKNVNSIMLEINRSLYMDETTGEKNDNFSKVKQDIMKVISRYKAWFSFDRNN